ncbi:MAG: hypothetical protein RLZZ399_2681, partial [Verrucomicrobiota bacterium]
MGLEAKLQGEYTGILAGKPVAAQVVARGDQCFHALVFDGGLPGDGWDGSPYALLESSPLENERAPFRSTAEGSTTTALLARDG